MQKELLLKFAHFISENEYDYYDTDNKWHGTTRKDVLTDDDLYIKFILQTQPSSTKEWASLTDHAFSLGTIIENGELTSANTDNPITIPVSTSPKEGADSKEVDPQSGLTNDEILEIRMAESTPSKEETVFNWEKEIRKLSEIEYPYVNVPYEDANTVYKKQGFITGFKACQLHSNDKIDKLIDLIENGSYGTKEQIEVVQYILTKANEIKSI